MYWIPTGNAAGPYPQDDNATFGNNKRLYANSDNLRNFIQKPEPAKANQT